MKENKKKESKDKGILSDLNKSRAIEKERETENSRRKTGKTDLPKDKKRKDK